MCQWTVKFFFAFISDALKKKGKNVTVLAKTFNTLGTYRNCFLKIVCSKFLLILIVTYFRFARVCFLFDRGRLCGLYTSGFSCCLVLSVNGFVWGVRLFNNTFWKTASAFFNKNFRLSCGFMTALMSIAPVYTGIVSSFGRVSGQLGAIAAPTVVGLITVRVQQNHKISKTVSSKTAKERFTELFGWWKQIKVPPRYSS